MIDLNVLESWTGCYRVASTSYLGDGMENGIKGTSIVVLRLIADRSWPPNNRNMRFTFYLLPFFITPILAKEARIWGPKSIAFTLDF